MAVSIRTILANSIPVIIAIYTNIYREADKLKVFPSHPVDYSLPQFKEYDFIIVGAGAAGAPLVNKLSKKFKVLLLESGGNPIPIEDVPISADHTGTPDSLFYNWNSTKQKSALDTGGIVNLAQGKCLGGGTSVNSMHYTRGNPKDFDNWAKLTKDNSWSYKNLLKYFKMSENFWQDNNENGELGVGGPIPIVQIRDVYKRSYRAFIAAGKELGYSTYKNCNGPQTPGVGQPSHNAGFGRRVSTYKAFLEPILNRKNLDIVRYAEVSKVNINQNMAAVGVYYVRHGIENYVEAKLEVILSAGTMNTPLILQRSGIGPADKLKEAGIHVKKDLPTGQNLQSQPGTVLCSTTNYPVSVIREHHIQQFLKHGKGPFTKLNNGVALGFIVSSSAKSQLEKEWPDIQLIAYCPNAYQLCINTIVTRGRGRGSIHLDPKNPLNAGLWDPHFLEDEYDVNVLAEGTQISLKMLKSKALADHGFFYSEVPHPLCLDYKFDSINYWKCFVHRTAGNTYHPAGSCKMGSIDDATAVVDTKLRVKGVRHLRVVDNSIQPVIVNTNTMASAIMIGQKGADIILQDYTNAGREETD